MSALVSVEAQTWLSVLRKFRRGQKLTKAEIQSALDTGHAPPAELNALFSSILNGECQFKYPDREPLPIPSWQIARHLNDLRSDIQNPDSTQSTNGDYVKLIRELHSRTKYRNRKRLSALQIAKKEISKMYGISERRVETIWRENKPT